MGKNRRYRPYDRYEGCTVFRHPDGRQGRICHSDPIARTVSVRWPDGTRDVLSWPDDKPTISLDAWQQPGNDRSNVPR